MTKEEMEQSMEKKRMMLRDDMTKKRDKKMKNNKNQFSRVYCHFCMKYQDRGYISVLRRKFM